MKKTSVVILLVLALGVWSAAQQDEILTLKEKIIELQNKGELGFRNFTFCSKILGFASYVPMENPVIDKNGELLIYYEPVDIFTNKIQGVYEIWFTQDMVVLDAKGGVIQEWKDILDYHQKTRLPVLDVYAQNNLSLGDQLLPGKYTFKAVLKDKLSGKTATKTAGFEVK
jgi:hypothetical protein